MTKEELKRAKAGDLIFIPAGLKERCSNCRFLVGKKCIQPDMRLIIAKPDEECCAYWDNIKVDRSEKTLKKTIE